MLREGKLKQMSFKPGLEGREGRGLGEGPGELVVLGRGKVGEGYSTIGDGVGARNREG